jgi:hypothetical protein
VGRSDSERHHGEDGQRGEQEQGIPDGGREEQEGGRAAPPSALPVCPETRSSNRHRYEEDLIRAQVSARSALLYTSLEAYSSFVSSSGVG